MQPSCATPFVKQVLQTQEPIKVENKVLLPVTNEAVIPILQQQYFPLLAISIKRLVFLNSVSSHKWTRLKSKQT